MPSHRGLRVAEAIREVVATAILFDVADPRVQSVTVLRAEVSPDLRQAKVFVSIMGTEAERKRTLAGLNHARGFLQSRVAARLQTRTTPVLAFQLDESARKSAEMARLIEEAVASDRHRDAEAGPTVPDGPSLPPPAADAARSETPKAPTAPTNGPGTAHREAET